MVATIGSLRAVLEVDRASFAAGLRSAGNDLSVFQKHSGQQLARMDQQSKSTFGRMSQYAASFSRGLVGGIAGAATAAGFAALIRSANEAARSVARIGDMARQAGLNVRDFQRLSFAAKQLRIETDDLSAGVRELQLRADEFIESAGKSGSAAEAFRRLGYSVADVERKLKAPTELLAEIIGRVQKLDRAAQIRIFDEIFGGDGERLIRLLSLGEDGLRKMMQRAEDVGAVLSEDVIKQADEINRKFEEISDTVSLNLKSAIVQASTALTDFINQFRAFEHQRTARLEQQLVELGAKRLEIETKIFKLRDEMRTNSSFTAPVENRIAAAGIHALEEELAEIAKREAEILRIIGEREFGEAGEAAGQAFGEGAGRGIRTGDAEKAAEEEARKAKQAFERFAADAERLAEQMFPGAAAAAEAEELLRLLNQFGDELSELQRIAVGARVEDLFAASALGLRDLSRDTEKTAKVVRKEWDPVREMLAETVDALYAGEDALKNIQRALAGVGRTLAFARIANFWREI